MTRIILHLLKNSTVHKFVIWRTMRRLWDENDTFLDKSTISMVSLIFYVIMRPISTSGSVTDQCLLRILSFLPLENLTICDRVSRKWRRLVTITLCKLDQIKIKHTQAVQILKRTPNVIQLTMIGISLNDHHLNTVSFSA